ncbi:MAG: hypothetical protein ACK41D_07100 [Rubricoccaceae bacterium]
MTPAVAPLFASLSLEGTRCAVAVREAWALSAGEKAALREAAREAGFGLWVVATCFRLEVLVTGDAPEGALLAWARARLAALDASRAVDGFQARTGEDALRHLFRVACGLESAVLGEAQILGQVRRARAEAEAAGVLPPPLRAALDAAVRAGQWARRATGLGRGTASMASAAVQWATDVTGGLSDRRVVVAGAGQMGRLLMGPLAAAAPAALTLVSGHAPPHAGFDVVRPGDLAALLPETDVLFAATNRTVLTAAAAAAVWDDARPRVVVDLGVPRNVEAGVGRLAHVRLANVDALAGVVEASLAQRQAAVAAVEQAIEQRLAALGATFGQLRREALVADFRRRAERVRRDTLAYVCRRCDDRTCGATGAAPGPGPCSDPDRLSRTLTTRLLHDLTARLRHDVADEATLRRLLAISDAAPAGAAPADAAPADAAPADAAPADAAPADAHG